MGKKKQSKALAEVVTVLYPEDMWKDYPSLTMPNESLLAYVLKGQFEVLK